MYKISSIQLECLPSLVRRYALFFSFSILFLSKKGFFFGFIAKNVAEQILIGQKQGTFLLRWSETTGAVDVVYSTGDRDTPVRHCLFNSPVKVSLPDWLRENLPLTHFFRIIPTISYLQFNVVSVPKDSMLQPFYSKKTPKPEEKHEGYGYFYYIFFFCFSIFSSQKKIMK